MSEGVTGAVEGRPRLGLAFHSPGVPAPQESLD